MAGFQMATVAEHVDEQPLVRVTVTWITAWDPDPAFHWISRPYGCGEVIVPPVGVRDQS
jgi:hypothetical protein